MNEKITWRYAFTAQNRTIILRFLQCALSGILFFIKTALIKRFVSNTTFIYSAFPNKFFFSSLSISRMSAKISEVKPFFSASSCKASTVFANCDLLFTSTNVNSQNLEQILEKYYEAVGMEYLKEVQTIQYKGNYYNRFLEKMGGNLPEKLLKPEFTLLVEKGIGYRLHVVSDPGQYVTGFFDGNYWMNQNGNVDANWNPSVPDRRIIQQAIDLEGFLYNWKSKGNKVVKLSDADLSGKKHYKIQLINTENDSVSILTLNPISLLILVMMVIWQMGKNTQTLNFRNIKKWRI